VAFLLLFTEILAQLQRNMNYNKSQSIFKSFQTTNERRIMNNNNNNKKKKKKKKNSVTCSRQALRCIAV